MLHHNYSHGQINKFDMVQVTMEFVRRGNGVIAFGGLSMERNSLCQLFLPADSFEEAVSRLRCKTSSTDETSVLCNDWLYMRGC